MQKATLVLAVLVLFASVTRAAGPTKIVNVAVSCSGDDAVGSKICASLKEKIRASSSFKLVGEEEARKSPKSLRVTLISEFVDDEHPKYHSAIAVVFTMPMPERQRDGFVNAWVVVVGDHKIDEEAATIMAELEEATGVLANLGALGERLLSRAPGRLPASAPPSTICAQMNSNDDSRSKWLLNPSVYSIGASSQTAAAS